METYRVIDLFNLYSKLDPNIAFLVLSDYEDEAENVKRIRIKPKCFSDMKYKKDETVRIILKNSSTGKYDVLDVPFQKGIYGMYNILNEKAPGYYKYLFYEIWKNWDVTYKDFEKKLTIFDNLIVLEKNQEFLKNVIITGDIEVGNTKMYLKKIDYSALPEKLEKELLNKCIQGGKIEPSDFFQTLDVEEPTFYFSMQFGNLSFIISAERVMLTKKLVGEEQEEIFFTFSRRRIGIPSMFFSYVIKAELENQLLQRIEEKFVY